MPESERAPRLQIRRFDIFAEWNRLKARNRAGQQITRFHSTLKKAAAEGWAEKISGQCVRSVRAHGKNLFIDFANTTGPDAWGEKLAHVWALRQQLVATYPEQIFSGKIRGGRIVLMSMERLQQEYARYHRPLETCSQLAQQLYAIIATQPLATQPLRQAAGLITRKERGRFERALQEHQSTFNIARSPTSDSGDVWVPFRWQYPQLSS
jgi:hypothetical protein